MSEPIERIARALFEADTYQGYNQETRNAQYTLRRRAYLNIVRMVLLGARDPTDEMLRVGSIAGKEVTFDAGGRRITHFLEPDVVAKVWKACIDELVTP